MTQAPEPSEDMAVEVAEEPVRPSDAVEALLDADDLAGAIEYARTLHGAELADVFEQLDDDDRDQVLGALDAETTASALSYVESHFRGELLQNMSANQIAETLVLEDDDVATDIVQSLAADTAEEVLDALPDGRREAIDALLIHERDTAGGRMTGQLVTLAPDSTVDEVLDQLRGAPLDVSQPFYLYVCDSDRTLVGVLNLRGLIAASPLRRARGPAI
ncbi:MAG: CBS domain-containing protein [Chloroflexi bacterium]|nr:CBS domain-containing protein [Chloroflexota bacterium]MDA1145491.1 CBS domain-containing protein [Chloroflexota bacterium]